jgi:S-methylmethionine-dependent homocysteine/selenocysteine methylase
VQIARDSSSVGDRVAGSIAPLADCYRPDLSPSDPRSEHRELAQALADAGCDILLCETFPHAGEAVVAVEEAAATPCPTWASFTAGPNADLLTPAAMADAARRVVQAGAAAVLVNCTPAVDTLRYVQAMADADLGVPLGAYANAGDVDDGIGWQNPTDANVASYLALARTWVDAGATLIGGCCGTGPAHIAALRSLR